MNTTENERPWATANQPLHMRWVSTDEGLRMRWERARAPRSEHIFVVHTEIEPIAA